MEKAKGSALSTEFFRKAYRHIKYVSDKLNLTKGQSVMMALFINKCYDTSISINDLAEHLDCCAVRLMRYANDIDELERRGFVRCSRRRMYEEASYRVPRDVQEAFKRNECYKPRNIRHISCEEIFNELEDIFKMRSDDELTYKDAEERTMLLLDCNKHLNFVKRLDSYGLMPKDQMLLILFCHRLVNDNDDEVDSYSLDFLYDNKTWRRNLSLSLSNEEHPLFSLKLIEFSNSSRFATMETFRLTRKAKEELLQELNIAPNGKENQYGCLIKAKNITEKQLFYDKKTSTQVAELKGLLDEKNYQNIRSRLKEQGFRCGFSCLLYGAPGTGKTETALQLARITGRDIMQVNISEIKSMWVGESEKNIQGLFDKYRRMTTELKATPILLFNEADAIIGMRKKGADEAVEKMENSIQNIILQEMETLDGILIATTNLEQNMDKAFERRFLYKIKFSQPTAEARTWIWKSMMPELTDGDARTLAERYNFSGGQIENIARRHAIYKILHGEKGGSMDALLSYCDNEKIEKDGMKKVGFN